MKSFYLMGLACLLAVAACAQAELMTVWSFGGSAATYTLVPQFDATGVATLEAGGGSMDATGGNGLAFTDANGNSYGAGQAIHWTDTTKSGGDAYITITLNTTGWQNLDLRWDYKSKYDTSKSKGGPVQFDLDYGIGGVWLPLANNQALVCDSAFHSMDLNLAAFTGLNNQASVQIKLHNLNEGTLKDGDYWQDNIQLTATRILQPPTPHPGDANNDGAVDVIDLGVLALNYDGTGKTWAQGDFSGDGAVDVIDLGVLAREYDWTGTPAGAVPEPASMAVLALGGLALLRRKNG